MRRPNRRPNYLEAKDITNWEETADFIVFKESADTIAINGDTGAEISRNTDSATVIQAAIDTLVSDGLIFIKPGTYEISTPISLDSTNNNVTLKGSGMGYPLNTAATILTIDANINCIEAHGTSANRITAPTFIDFKIYNPDSNSGIGISINYARHARVTNCSFRSIVGEAISVLSSWGMTVEGCIFTSCGDSGTTKPTIDFNTTGGEFTTASRITDCSFQTDFYRSIQSRSTSVFISGNYFEGNNTVAPSSGFIWHTSTEARIIGNVMSDSRANSAVTNIRIYSEHAIIACNSIFGGQYGIRLDSSGAPQGCIICFNSLIECQDYGIRVQEDKPNLIFGNVCDTCGDGTNLGGIAVEGEAYVYGNVIFDSQENGITINGAQNSIISNNWIFEQDNSGVQVNGIEGIGAEDNNFIFDNIIQDFTGAAITGTGASTLIRRNIGYVTENGGVTGNVADGGTFAHGCSSTPTYVVVTPSTANEFVSVTAIGAANVTVAIKKHDGSAGTAQPLYWRAYV